MSNIRDKMRRNAERRVRQSQESKDFKPSNFVTFFTLPEGLEQWLPKGNEKGIKHYFDLVPFLVGPNFPDKIWGKEPPKEGEYIHVLDLFVHNNIGPNNETVVCPKLSFSKNSGCPICEELASRQANADDEAERKQAWADLKYIRRCLYLVVVRDGGDEEEKGLQVFDMAHWSLQRHIDKASEEDERRKGIITYSDVDDGNTIKFVKTSKGSGANIKVTIDGVELMDRVVDGKSYVIEDKFVEEAAEICLDSFLKLYSYDELKALHEKGVNKSNTEDEDQRENTTTTTRGTRGRSRREEPQKENEETQERPSRTRRSREEVEDKPPFDEDKEGCPYGHEFGKDCRNTGDCSDCSNEKYKACDEEFERLNAEQAEAKTSRRLRRR